MIERLNQPITFYFWFTASKKGKAGLTVTVTVYHPDGTVAATGSAVEVGGGLYRYTLASPSQSGGYSAIATTADSTVDAQDVPALWIVGTSWVGYLDQAISGVAGKVWDVLTSALTAVGSVGEWVLQKLDAAVSSRLASGGYTAPDNASVAAIKAKTDNLPADPASDTTVNTRLAAGAYTSPPTVPQIVAGVWDEPQAGHTAAGTFGSRLDAAVGTRMATFTYTAPPTAGDIATAVDTLLTTNHGSGLWTGSGGSGGMTLADLQTELDARLVDAAHLGHLDADVSTRLPSTGYAAPPTAAAISTQVRADLTTDHGAGPWTAADVSALATSAALASAAADVTTLVGRLTAARAALLDNLDGLVELASGTVGAVASATQFSAPVSASLGAGSGDYTGKQVFFTSGALSGTRWPIAEHTQGSGSQNFTLDATPSQAPAVGDTFDVI